MERQALQVIVEADLAWLEDLREGSNMRFILCINRLAASKKTEAWTEQQYRAIATVLLDDEARRKRLEEKGLLVQLDSQDKYYLSTVELAQLPDHERTKIARALREFDDVVERHNNSGGIQTNEQGEICIGGDYRLKSSFEDELADILGPVDPKYQQAFTLKLALERLSKRPKAEGRRTRDYLASEGADALRESFGNF